MIIQNNNVKLEFDDSRRTPVFPIIYHEWIDNPKRFDVIIDSEGFIFFTEEFVNDNFTLNNKIFMDSTGLRWTLNQIINNAPKLLMDVCIISASLNGLTKIIMLAIPEIQNNDRLMLELMKLVNENDEYEWAEPREKTGDPWEDLPKIIEKKVKK